jgi:glycosyltransferase involved in cell wall biosynthesis
MPEPLRIAQVAPIAEPVVPEAGSAIEQLVRLLTEELVRRGHEVTLFATGDSRTSARLRSVYPRSYKKDWRMWDNWQYHELMHLASAFERAGEFDVIHSHVYHFAPPLARLVRTPALHTDHIPQTGNVRAVYTRYPDAHIVALSRYHRDKFEGLEDVPIVYNGVDTGSFPYGEKGGDYLLFLGHMIERKGPVEAIEVARKAGMRLVMAGDARDGYFDAKVKPLVDGKLVEYVGPVGIEERNELLAGAGALLFTSLYSEPFGLVMVEAMACGTPVAALERCAVPEIVDRGATGYYARDAGSLAAMIPEVLALDRAHVREQAQKRFDHRRMTGEYEALYNLAAGRSGGVVRWFA